MLFNEKDGLRVTKPAMTSNNTNVSAYNIKDNDTLCDFKISPDWTCTNNNIDEVTDWSYKAVTTNPQNAGQKMYTTMTQEVHSLLSKWKIQTQFIWKNYV